MTLEVKADRSMGKVLAQSIVWSDEMPERNKIRLLIHNKTSSLPLKLAEAFGALKEELAKAAVATVQYDTPSVVDTDASDVAIAATLNQNDRPVAFFSSSLASNERHHSAIEEEAYAVVESIRKWKQSLLCSHFKLITDRRSVAFSFANQHKGKFKNDKIERWRLGLSSFELDVVYRPGKENRPLAPRESPDRILSNSWRRTSPITGPDRAINAGGNS
ncbi:hypothetical protein SprV_0100399100 [Sparganum proliferum]